MKRNYIIGIFIVFLVALGSGIFWLKPDTLSNRDTIIATTVPADIALNGEAMGVDGRYIPGSRIVAIQDFTDSGRGEPIVLTGDFHSARAPEISYDGKSMLFSGQKSASDTWQIYLMDLKSFKVQQVSDCEENCTDPTWLPDGRVAFSRLLNEEVAGEIHALYVCNPDGSELGRLTWHPNSVYASTIFQDGRIMSLDEQKYPVNGKRKLMAARIDGSKSELYYQSPEAHEIAGKSRELNGKVYFVERINREGSPSNLIAVDQGRPLSSSENLSGSIAIAIRAFS